MKRPAHHGPSGNRDKSESRQSAFGEGFFRSLLVQSYGGDRKCSSSTWWNTDNPRNLFEHAVLPIRTKFKIPPISEWSLWSLLEKRYGRIRHSGRRPMGWFKAPPDQLLDDVNAWLRDGHQLQIDSSWALPQQVQDRYVYLVAEADGQFVKLGKCDRSKTSPPIRRLCQYQRSNPRRLDVVASWKSDTPGSIERTLQAMLRRWCVSNGRRFWAEWFEISSNDALDVLQRGISRFNLDVGLCSLS